LLAATISATCGDDLSGWSPKYIPPALLKEAAGRLNAKFLFGSDYPFIPPDRWLKDFAALEGWSDEARTENVQQIHSLRASSVRSSHAASASASEARVFRKSSGKSWTTPAEISLVFVVISLYEHTIALSRKDYTD
jgi:hypothetical protein